MWSYRANHSKEINPRTEPMEIPHNNHVTQEPEQQGDNNNTQGSVSLFGPEERVRRKGRNVPSTEKGRLRDPVSRSHSGQVQDNTHPVTLQL